MNMSKESKIAKTKKGDVEYRFVGTGPVVLSLHGGLGGWDQGIVIADDWLDISKNGFSVLSPSRPGYLRTPLETGKSPKEAADAMAALMDDLNIDKVFVLGTSGGGPTALEFALRHPDRTRALIMFSAISKKHIQPGRASKKWYGRFLFSKIGGLVLDIGWFLVVFMVKHFKKPMIKTMFKATTLEDFDLKKEVEYTLAHQKALKGVIRLMETQYPLSTRKTGLDNDLKTNAEMLDYPVDQIKCPTLVVHGRLDGNVPFSHAEFTATIPNAKMHIVESGGHLVAVGSESDKMRSFIINFLKNN